MMNKPNIQKTSAEVINVLNARSAKNLPNNPSASGWTPDQIKRCFWQPFLADDVSILTELNRLVEEINAYLDTVYAHVGAGEVEQIGEAYQLFLRENESGITGLANATWRVLSDHLERFRAQAEEIAANVEEVRRLASSAESSASSVQQNAAAAEESKKTAVSAATSASAAEATAVGAAEAAREAEQNLSAFKGMERKSSLETYFYVGSTGELEFSLTGEIGSYARLRGNTVSMIYDRNGKPGNVLPIWKTLKEVFSCRIVEIVIDEQFPNRFNDEIFYKEVVPSQQTIATTDNPTMQGGTDGNNLVITRLMQARDWTAGTGTVYYYIVFSSALVTAVTRAFAQGAANGGEWAEQVPIKFIGYN